MTHQASYTIRLTVPISGDTGTDFGPDFDFGFAETLASVEGAQQLVVGVDVSLFDAVQLEALVSGVRLLQRQTDGLAARIGVRANELAAVGESAPAGDMMRDKGSVPASQARRDAGRVKAAEETPGLGDAVSVGETSGAHLDAITRLTGGLTAEQKSQIDRERLVERAKDMPIDAFVRMLRRLVDGITTDHGLADTKKKQAASKLRWWFDESSGMGCVSGQLDPESFEKLTTAVEQQMASMAAASDGTVKKDNNLAARALIELVTGSGSFGARSRLPLVTVIVDHKTTADGPHVGSVRQTVDGHDVPPETVSRLFCDAVVRRVVLDARGVPINVGKRSRTATDAQWTAVKAIYDTCSWDGCSAPLRWCQLHHIHEWSDGGGTDMCNLVPLCSRHHHQVHEDKWSIKLLKDRRLQIHRPDGELHATVPTPTRC